MRRRTLGFLPECGDQVHYAEQFAPVADHVPVARLSPAKHSVSIEHEGGSVRNISILVKYTIGPDDRAVYVAQEWEREAMGLSERFVAGWAVPADRQEHGASLAELAGDLSQAGKFRGSDAPPIEAVEAQDHILASELLQRNRATRG